MRKLILIIIIFISCTSYKQEYTKGEIVYVIPDSTKAMIIRNRTKGEHWYWVQYVDKNGVIQKENIDIEFLLKSVK
jgi:hypothetical protein